MNESNKFVFVPEFEILGPPCSFLPCKGSIINCISLDNKDFYKKCNICNIEVERLPAKDMIDKLSNVAESYGVILC